MGWSYTLEELASVIGPQRLSHSATFSRISTDTRTLQRGDVFFALPGPNYDANQFVPQAFEKGACAVVTTKRKKNYPCIVVHNSLDALKCFAAYHRSRFCIPLLALTGSCGKTMAKDLTAAVLETKFRVIKTQGNLNNEIGCPLSLLQIDETTEFAVIEMGANHLGEISELCLLARPTEAAITMIAPAHLEGFKTPSNVAKAKGEIISRLDPENGVFYANADDAWCQSIAQKFPGAKLWFGRTGDVALEYYRVEAFGDMRLRIMPVGDLRLPLYCRAHITNVLLAIAVGLRHGVREFEAPLREALKSSARFNVYKVGPIEVIDDSYNANPSSMAAALDAMADRPGGGARIAALGEMLELGKSAKDLHRSVGEHAGKTGVTHLFVTGPHAKDMAKAARAAGVAHVCVAEDAETIAKAIHALAQPDDVLLVKGSRGMRMERVIEALQQQYRQGESCSTT